MSRKLALFSPKTGKKAEINERFHLSTKAVDNIVDCSCKVMLSVRPVRNSSLCRNIGQLKNSFIFNCLPKTDQVKPFSGIILSGTQNSVHKSSFAPRL